jgi:hypothetical protein
VSAKKKKTAQIKNSTQIEQAGNHILYKLIYLTSFFSQIPKVSKPCVITADAENVLPYPSTFKEQ